MMNIGNTPAEERINLATLQHKDPFIKSIKATAKHVNLYTFKADTNEWEKTDVEGTCFVYERSAAPNFGFMILNQRGTNNFVEPIRASLEFQLQVPFLLYRNPPLIYGIWFYESQECKYISELLQRLVHLSKQTPVQPQPAAAPAETQSSKLYTNTASTAGTEILQLLTKAQTEFSEKSEPPGVTSKHEKGMEMIKPQAVKPGQSGKPEEGQSITIDDLFKNASGAASVAHTDSSDTIRVKRLPENDAHSNTAFRRPLPVSQMTTVTEIERQHTPELADMSQLVTPASFVSGKPSGSSNQPQVTQRFTAPSTPNLTSGLQSQSQLMSPMAFSIARRDSNSTTQIPVAINPPQHVNVSESNMMYDFGTTQFASVMASVLPNSSTAQSAASTPPPVSALTKEQLRQAMMHLLNNDEQFLQSLHSAYIQSLNASIRR